MPWKSAKKEEREDATANPLSSILGKNTPNMRKYENMIQNIVEERLNFRCSLGAPMPSKKPLITKVTAVAGRPITLIARNSDPYFTTSSDGAVSFMTSFPSTKTITLKIPLTMKLVIMADLKEIRAFCFSPFPQSCDMSDCAAEPNAFMGEVKRRRTISASPMAEICSVDFSPVCPIIIVAKKLWMFDAPIDNPAKKESRSVSHTSLFWNADFTLWRSPIFSWYPVRDTSDSLACACFTDTFKKV